jgi:CHAT domain-containing protein
LLLYQSLVKDFITHVKTGTRLLISADGPLLSLPFETLITQVPNDSEVNYHLPYLIAERNVDYVFSAGVLLKQMKRKREGEKLLALGYAGSGGSRENRTGLNNLPGTEREVMSIKNVMKNHVNKYFLEGGASEATFKQQASGFDIVHLAVHGEADTTNAMNSRLVFRSEQDSVEDGSLYAHELYEIDLSTLDLAVLSACESGVGKHQVGEGTMSIARGFAYAGCPSLVISLWKIDDKTSANIMEKFYTHLAKGEPIDLALAKSKVEYMAGAKEFNSHPYYWAAFLPVGNPLALDTPKPNWWGWVCGCVVTGGLISWWLSSYHRKRQYSQQATQ